MTNKQTAKDKIEILVNRFEEQYQSYRHSDYNETLTRRDFIDPFFKTLGWDIDNEAGYAEAYREVIHEDKVKVSGATKAPDYSFRLVGGKRLFFVEAKKPCISVKDDVQPAYQVRRYGWSAKHPISIITDFEEFAIYDCTKKPNPTDKPAVARIKYLTFRDYIKDFDFIWDTFSKEQVLKGSFDKFLLSDTHKKGTATVDKDFLESLNRWRTYLAVDISWNNKTLDEDEINYVVQQTIDRIIFLRIAEDRSIEPYGNLKHATKQGNLYQNLFDLFHKADEKYNSGLFDFKKDKISQNVIINNKIIRTIINELYYPECPYEFSVLSVEILGSAYEQFLGKVIRITPAHHAKIEDKPEVRKAGGVYYTPEYVVNYIVKNTLGKVIEGKTPKEISKIKILDPACGSGSFLIGAFQYLLDYHKDYYSENGRPSKGKKDNPLTPDGNLTTAEKKRILLNNIYGVDLDNNAVEVTKLSLLVKCLEGETQASIQQQLSIWNERVLPTLENNIKSGNSLIENDFYDNKLDFDSFKKIKPFNWINSFPEIFKSGGFDIIMGNPPYGALLTEEEDHYFRVKYSVSNYQLDTYNLFIEKGLSLLVKNGVLGFIIPSAWVASKYDDKFRKYISEKSKIERFVISQKKTFAEATVETCIIVISNSKPDSSFVVERWDQVPKVSYCLDIKDIKKENNYIFPVYSNEPNRKIIEKIKNASLKLQDIADVIWGVKIYEKNKGIPPQKGDENISRVFHSDVKSKNTHRPLLGGKEIKRYYLDWNGGYIDYGKWLAAPRKPIWFDGERIVVREVTAKGIIQATFLNDDFVFSNSVDGIKIKNNKFKIKALLSILNSKLVSFYNLNTSANAYKGSFPKVLLQDLRELPIPNIDDIQMTFLENCCDKLLTLYKQKQNSTLHYNVTQIQNQIDYLESKIDEVVYQLYNLTPKDIEQIEQSSGFASTFKSPTS
jgi:type I restriction-modification system DNA methylase subunit